MHQDNGKDSNLLLKGVNVLKQHPARRQFLRYAQIIAGCALTCVGFDLFLIPAHLLTGGISGIAFILYYVTGVPAGLQNLIYNIPILFFAYRVFGRLYAVDTIVGTVVQSLLLDAFHFMITWQVCTDPMLSGIFGGVLAGIGFGMIFRANANTGGLDVVAAITKKYYSVNMGTVVFSLNLLIIIGSMALFGTEIGLYSLVSIYATAELTNRVAAGLNREKSIIIISPASKEICADIMQHVRRGVTYLDGRGGFSEEPKGILFVVVSLTQVSRVKTIVYHYDPQAFMIVSSTSEVSGKGFTLECESYEIARKRWLEAHGESKSDKIILAQKQKTR